MARAQYPKLEPPDPTIAEAMVPVGQAIIDAEAKLDAYPGWQSFLQRIYTQLERILTGEEAA